MLGTQLPAPNMGSQPIDLGGTGPPAQLLCSSPNWASQLF